MAIRPHRRTNDPREKGERPRNGSHSRLRADELQTILDIGIALGRATGLDETLRVVAERTARALGCPEVEIIELLPETGELRLSAFFEQVQTQYRERLGQTITGDEAELEKERTKTPEISVTRRGAEDLHPSDRAMFERWGDQVYVRVPLWFGDRPLGVMILTETDRDRHFDRRELAFAAAIGDQASLAIHTARQYERERQQNRRLTALVDAVQVLASGLAIDDVMIELARATVDALDADQCEAYEYDPETETVVQTAVCRRGSALAPEDVERRYRLSGELPLAADAYPLDIERMTAGELVLDTRSDVDLHPATKARMERYDERTTLTVPLGKPGRIVGFFVVVQHESERRFTSEELTVARALAKHATVALEKAQLYRRLEILAITDGLTGLFNHRHFYERLAQEVRRADRYGSPLPLLLIDIDDFKAFNDSHGHQAGDEALRRVAGAISGQLREGIDVVARYGGEEFAALLPGSLDAIAAAERIRARVAATDLPTVAGVGHLTVSVGVADYPDSAADAEELVARADAAMYTAKRLGRDRVEVAFGTQ